MRGLNSLSKLSTAKCTSLHNNPYYYWHLDYVHLVATQVHIKFVVIYLKRIHKSTISTCKRSLNRPKFSFQQNQSPTLLEKSDIDKILYETLDILDFLDLEQT